MNLTDFAECHGLRVINERRTIKTSQILDGRPKPDQENIPGKRGWIVGAEGGLLNLFVATRRVEAVLAEAKKLQIKIQGRGEAELWFWFDPANEQQADFAIRTIRARRRRCVKVTPELRERLAAIRQARRMPVPA